MSDAEWLRERPEIVTACDEGMGEFAEEHGGTDECTDFNMTAAGLARALPYLRAAIRADVVRELAGDGVTDAMNALADAIAQKDGVAAVSILLHDRAAAHAQGRAAGREEAAGVESQLRLDGTVIGPLYNAGWAAAIAAYAKAIRMLTP